ncbi:amidohydrolase family protein [Amycolatopsis jejuensis]|uniref:amidohydrolase family protein n=1 Tax=Amycolatopsis jejuensis TaxID=330084 RepID=UPI000524F3AD|nr:amidohydrolase family protein [Amycolatopsis jejuensis]
MIVIDTHCHIGHSQNSDSGDIGGESLIRGMDAYGIDAAIVLPLPSVEDHATEHDDIARLAQRHPGRIFGTVCIRPQLGSAAVHRETKRCVEDYGFVAMKFHPMHHGGSPASPRGDVIFEVAQEFGLPVMCHTGPGAPWALPSMLIPAARKYPDVTFIAAHSGMEIYAEDAWVAASECQNIVLDSAWTSPGRTAWLIDRLGADRMMMSTDLPTNNSTETAKWRDLDISEKDKETCLHHLPVRLFDLAAHGFDPARFTKAPAA